ncbi:uncharacterized protein LOC124899257 isoform X3 [Capsicum annuum]|uniref:uncharacterized protein LOC124899257 isoform X3 n=1 Tax=Capsicum annuum TaxID=4072 RepID=UPI001FB0A05E|nr:uncharacterized protein LOC124899257 isoform X3 [Capsicum annuum]
MERFLRDVGMTDATQLTCTGVVLLLLARLLLVVVVKKGRWWELLLVLFLLQQLQQPHLVAERMSTWRKLIWLWFCFNIGSNTVC